MKNQMFLFLAFAFVLLCTSCNKEELLEPQDPAPTTIDYVSDNGDSTGASTRNTVIQITVQKTAVVQTTNQLNVTVSSSYDLSDVTLESSQTLTFADANNNETSLSFDVVNFVGAVGSLQANFSIGGNNLTGLELKDSQRIIIEDDLVH